MRKVLCQSIHDYFEHVDMVLVRLFIICVGVVISTAAHPVAKKGFLADDTRGADASLSSAATTLQKETRRSCWCCK